MAKGRAGVERALPPRARAVPGSGGTRRVGARAGAGLAVAAGGPLGAGRLRRPGDRGAALVLGRVLGPRAALGRASAGAIGAGAVSIVPGRGHVVGGSGGRGARISCEQGRARLGLGPRRVGRCRRGGYPDCGGRPSALGPGRRTTPLTWPRFPASSPAASPPIARAYASARPSSAALSWRCRRLRRR